MAEFRLFISYRRSDDPSGAGRLFDRLESEFGEGNVFIDVDSKMPLGVDFRNYLARQVEQADILLVVIGPNWLRLIQEKAADPSDFVRLEIEIALSLGVTIVPVILGHEVRVPSEEELPPSIGRIAYNHGIVVDRGADFRSHADRLIGRLMALRQDQPDEGNLHTLAIQSVGEDEMCSQDDTLEELSLVDQWSQPAVGKCVNNSLGMEFVWCPPGTFVMGSPKRERGRSRIEIQHEVRLTAGFYISRFLVTQGQWEALMGSNPSHFRKGGEDAPVEMVSSWQAIEFCSVLTERETPKGRYTLPTEAQWEFACRGGSLGPYAGEALNELGWFCENSGGRTQPVGQKMANPWGIFDLHGNVWEWCLDWYAEYPRHGVVDPIGPKEGMYRVFRGGSWYDSMEHCRAGTRFKYEPTVSSFNIGFRPVMIPIA